MLQLRNPSHLAYLSRNLLKCPRVVRQSITRQRLPVYAQPAVSTNYHQFLERMFVLLYGLECDAEHDPKQWADQIKAEYFSLFRARGYDPGMNDIRVPLLPRVLASLQLSDSDVFVDLGCSTGRLAMAARLLPLCAFDDDDDNHDDVTSSAANTTTSTASARFACARHVFGVELSPTRVAEAQKAVARFQSIRQQQRAGIQTLLAVASSASSSSSSSSSEAAATTSIELERSAENISFICGDIVDSTVLPLGSVYFLGVRLPHDDKRSQSLLTGTLAAIRRVHRDAGYPFGPTSRAVCVGFLLPEHQDGDAGLRLQHATCFPDDLSASQLHQHLYSSTATSQLPLPASSESSSHSSASVSASLSSESESESDDSSDCESKAPPSISSTSSSNHPPSQPSASSPDGRPMTFESFYGDNKGARLLFHYEIDLRPFPGPSIDGVLEKNE